MKCSTCGGYGGIYHGGTDKFYCESCYANLLAEIREEVAWHGNDYY